MHAQHATDPEALPAQEEDYYTIVDIPIPDGIELEVGGMTIIPDGSLGVATRRGEVWLIENPYMTGSRIPRFSRFASGLHEPLGLAYHEGSLYTSQRSELTRLTDKSGNREADAYETVVSWPLSGNYHEYSYGPLFTPEGDMLITLNLGWIGHGASLAKWRGWMMKVSPDGKMTPIASGMRSPAGFGYNAEGDVFYTENQGDWVGSGRITHVEKGDFVGNPEGLVWSHLEESPVKLKPEDIPDTGKPMSKVAADIPGFKTPAVWLPHGLMGISTSAIIADKSGGEFGPFTDQLFVGDQGHSKIVRIYLEKVNGVYQGVAFPFREGFSSGILRMVWGKDASLFVGMTSRGWGSTGKAPFGLQRLVWTGKVPFEIKTVKAQPDGFELEFTMPVNESVAKDPDSYQLSSFNYKYHHNYGSPVIELEKLAVKGAIVAEDGMTVRLVIDGLKEGYIHEINAAGIKSKTGMDLLHAAGYYTLNQIPDGEKVNLSEIEITPANPHQDHQKTSGPASNETNVPTSAPSTTENSPKRMTVMPDGWSNGPDQTIVMGTKPGLKYDLENFEVKAGSKVKITFNNNDDMLHNLVIVMPNTAIEVGEMALKMGLEGSQKDYIPNSDKVLYHTNILSPETSETIYFEAPSVPGDYTYVCTFPGHAYVMQGIMRVSE
ncbi:plastocyanin/azurin family copper-binding protein [Cyclobacterium jeungdonense]|uniref:Plastocyanin/azurin family copper-binding protein n=1 Tax=Cyclobacterium jeungdonense TaxID=708087 RepID=A0ABT8CC54_9BACT|nr:plastocyanin/azurin family copper-binding protein [Cyclobacterium jeungdonense]MDN3689534.1 plastocyanin/azurin family copper-binding protein [Cyclobacterium jeungdonense]